MQINTTYINNEFEFSKIYGYLDNRKALLNVHADLSNQITAVEDSLKTLDDTIRTLTPETVKVYRKFFKTYKIEDIRTKESYTVTNIKLADFSDGKAYEVTYKFNDPNHIR